ncbi:MAG: hypothetical protein H6831_09840 [Planctomycetes bacterium]|nr:hypothetical protein [Planctomycetota bacterium]MCB9904695.1 hypothetical protein [Planctomycetota bacterium]
MTARLDRHATTELPFAPPAARRPDWRALLCGGTPREVLARIVDGDPLGLRPRIAAALRRGAWLMDADRVLLRALALCARRGASYRGRPAIDEWLEARVQEAIEDLLEEEHAARAPASAAFADLARPLALSPERLRAACARFHARPREEREAYVRLVLDRRPLEESGTDPLETARRARRATLALLGGEGS